MPAKRVALSVAIGGILVLQQPFGTHCHLAQAAGASAIKDALRIEIDGPLDERSQGMEKALQANPSLKEAHWHTGDVKADGKWVTYDKLSERLANDKTLREYRELRDAAPMTYEAQLELANWCRAHKLSERERAHLTVALDLSDDPDNAQLRARLGFKRVDNGWLSEQDIAGRKKTQLEYRNQIKTWQPRVKRLAEKLKARNADARDVAERELREITDPAAIPALELALADSDGSRLLVDVLGAMKSYKAAEGLARLAVFSESDAVREEACNKLRSRSIGEYTPQLLSTLRTPADSKLSLFVTNGAVYLTHEISSETQSSRQLIDRNLTTVVEQVNVDTSSLTGQERSQNRLNRAVEVASVDAKLEARSIERKVEQENEQIENWNKRVCGVLSAATSIDLPADPKSWWEWWRTYNQMSEVEKPTERKYSDETRTQSVQNAPTVDTGSQITGLTITGGGECLVAGTPIWTDRGFVAVEAMKVGDLVLAKHPETGELAYRPVLRTSIRQPEPIMKATTSHGEIRGTGAHSFWISGAGWTKLRDLRPGQRLHGARGPSVVQSVKPDGTAKTYNLVVADFHTYFVGDGMVLSQDLTLPAPVDTIIPGLAAN